MPFPAYVKSAIVCGKIPRLRKWQTLPIEKLTTGEKVLRFAADHLKFPEGKKIGQPLILDPFQQAFILAAFGEKSHIDKAILSMARRGGKTLVMAVILLAYVVGPLAKQNTLIRSAAMTREQAGLIFRFMELICNISPDLEGLYHTTPSSKCVVGLNKNVEYRSCSRDAKSGHGQGIYVLVLDEAGQIEASHDEFLDMLFSSMGTFEDSKTFIISTQAPSDAAFLSLEIDAAIRDQPDNVVCHLYTADNDELMDEKNWYQANPALYGGYRSKKDIKRLAEESVRIPAKQSGVLNLIMNRRVSRESIWLAPKVYRDNGAEPDFDVFREKGVYIGLDLSQRNDLTAAVIAAEDDEGFIHVFPYAFSPLGGLIERERRDKVPYTTWAREGILITPPGSTMNYDWVADYLAKELKRQGIEVLAVEFDRWRIHEFKAAALRNHFGEMAVWHEVGQGYQSMSPRLEAAETAMLQGIIKHGLHPTLNLAASHAIAVSDPAGSKKLDKSKTRMKIDPLVALVMAIYPLISKTEPGFDVSAMIG